MLFRQLFCQCAVGRGLAVGDFEQQFPYFLPEGRTDGVERRGKVRFLPAEVNIQPALCLGENGRFLLLMHGVKGAGKVLLPFEPQPGQAHFICRQQDAAQRGIIVQCVHHGVVPFTFSSSGRSRAVPGEHRRQWPTGTGWQRCNRG